MGRNSHNELKSMFAGDQQFMTGHQIMKVRRPRRRVPQWVFEDNRIRALLSETFPKLATDDGQRKRAGRWARVIQLYFRSRKSYRETAEEMGEKPRTIEMIIRSIYRVSKGRTARANGKKVRVRAVSQTKCGDRDKDPLREPQSQLTL